VILAGLGGGHRVGRIGAFHQTGRTGLIVGVILCPHGAARAVEDVLRDLAGGTPQ
jgi:hypothetical protein